MTKARILSMDPGTTNYGVTVLDVLVKNNELKVKLIGSSMLERPIKNPLNASVEQRAYTANIYHLEHLYGPFDYVCAERFQSRGLKGKTVESVNIMIGTLLTMYPKVELYTAGTWKNAFNRLNEEYNLKEVYDDLKDVTAHRAKADRHQIHELDCALMGQYYAAKIFGLTPFANLEGAKRIGAFLRHFDSAPKL